MKLLAIETSGSKGSLALAQLDDRNLLNLHICSWSEKAKHSELATVKLQELLTLAHAELKDLTHLAVNLGPGSFTGLRVGLNMARTLAYTLGLPIATTNTLELNALALTQGLVPGTRLLIAIKAIQNYFYAAKYEISPAPLGLREVLAPSSVADFQLADLAKDCTKVVIEGRDAEFTLEITARDLVQWILARTPPPTFCDWKSVSPLYLRASEAEEKMKKGLLKPLL